MAEYGVDRFPLHAPSLEEVASVLEKGLQKNFSEAKVSVVDCPDLTKEPFHLACTGLCGHPRVSDIGGIPYISPFPAMDKVYDLKNVPKWSDLQSSPSVFMVGAGAGPSLFLDGKLVELMSNIRINDGQKIINQSKICKICENGSYLLEEFGSSTECMHLSNIYVSEGKPGKVIQVKAKHRTGKEDFIMALQSALSGHYGTKPVGLGGVFLLTKGKAKIHIMPCYSVTPIGTEEEIDNWLKYFEMSSPLICLGYLMSHDPGWTLRMEHFHCFSKHGDGGHFHFDTTPDDAEYTAYFNVPDYMIRVDQPTASKQ